MNWWRKSLRPLRLELEGFASFKERTVVDFEGADLFVLAGPMGAGKSSIIDALGFALYGSISRYENANLVAPLISQGHSQARVRLDFRLGSEDYTAVRVVRKSARGMINTEGRLERGQEVLAGNQKDLTEAVTQLLGMNFSHFTRCVVLPQGEFSDLLHAKPAERQDLIVRLLDLDLYRKVGARAKERYSRADASVHNLQSRIDTDLRNATEESYAAAAARLDRLDVLVMELAGDEEPLAALQASIGEARSSVRSAEERRTALAAVSAPKGIDDLGARLQASRQKQKQAQDQHDGAVAALEKAQAARADLPERASLSALINAYEEQDIRTAAVAKAETRLAACAGALKAAESKLAAAQAAETDALAKRDALLQADAAYHASLGLKAGDTCPVCGETLTSAPKAAAPKGIEQAEKTLTAARQLHRAAREAFEAARTEQGRREQALASERDQLAAVLKRLKGQPARDQCQSNLRDVDAAEGAMQRASNALRDARAGLAQAEADAGALVKQERQAWEHYRLVRDTAVKAGAEPGAAPDDIAAAWLALVACADQAAASAAAEAIAARAKEQQAQHQEQHILAEQARKCALECIEVDGMRPRDAVNAARGSAAQELRHIDEKLADRRTVEHELKSCQEVARVAGALDQHLKPTRFERWYIQEALNRLVRGATQRLWDLSGQQYSLALNSAGTDFVVVDHINANEERPVRTLSGGETFLASLALALALGDDIASLAANGAARLDALFLDEGFGTLDANTLETVATTIEELGARGRMVGIVTHVEELAARVPVRFQVYKERGSSRVERVDAR
jgi:exonuclease SbcC